MLLQRRRAEAIALLDEFLVTQRSGLRLDDAHIAAGVTKGAIAAWQLDIAGESCTVGVKENFPFVPAVIWLSSDSDLLKAPHIEDDGKMCLNPAQSAYSQGDVVGLSQHLLIQAEELIKKCRDGSNREDFITEFRSYWSRDQKADSRTLLTLVRPKGPSRSIRCFANDKLVLFAEGDEEAQVWLNNRYGGNRKEYALRHSVLVWFSKALFPDEYPKTANQFYKLAQSVAPESLPLLNELAVSESGHCLLLFGFDTERGPTFGAVTVNRPKDFEKGFRAGKVSGYAAVARCFGSEAILSGNPTRVDHEWIHTRGGELEQAKLRDKSILLVGCGSLGSGVAAMLAKSGVGRLNLCDSERLEWANIARHQLGAQAVNKRKAEALMYELKAQMPHLKIECMKGEWQREYDRNPQAFNEVDLVICTTGDWISESPLNLVARRNTSFPPVLFGWTEAHAMAGHGLLVADIGGCLGCGSDQFGSFSRKATEWNEAGTMISEAACGGHYQPFGWIHLAHIQSLVAEMAVDFLLARINKSQLRSWIAARETVNRFGGEWSADAVQKSGGRNESFCSVCEWICSPNCNLCRCT